MCKDWADGKVFQQYDVVVYIPLWQQQLRSVGSLPELITKLKLRVNSQDILSCIQDKNGEGVLVIADGWNYLDRSKRQIGSFFYNLLFGHVLSSASVVVTSRPTASAALHQVNVIDQFIEIRGFDGKSVEAFVKAEFASSKLEFDMFLEQLDYNPLLSSLCSFPITCKQLCHLQHTVGWGLLPSMTELCTAVVTNIMCFMQLSEVGDTHQYIKLAGYE